MELLRAVHGKTTGEAYWGPGDRYTFLVTGSECGGAMFAFDCVVAPGGGPPPHRHLRSKAASSSSPPSRWRSRPS